MGPAVSRRLRGSSRAAPDVPFIYFLFYLFLFFETHFVFCVGVLPVDLGREEFSSMHYRIFV